MQNIPDAVLIWFWPFFNENPKNLVDLSNIRKYTGQHFLIGVPEKKRS